jgi:hypothetical protein
VRNCSAAGIFSKWDSKGLDAHCFSGAEAQALLDEFIEERQNHDE